MKTEKLKRYLEGFGSTVVKESKGILKANKGDTALGKSIRVQVDQEENGYSVKFYMLDYGTYLDKGVSGNEETRSFTNYKLVNQVSPYQYTTKGPPIDILSKWVEKKGLKPKGWGKGRDKDTGRYISGLAIYISHKIKVRGIPSISFFQKPLGSNYVKLKDKILKEFTEDVQVYLTTFTK